MFAENVLGEMLGMEFAPIELEVADDLGSWSLTVPGMVNSHAGQPRAQASPHTSSIPPPPSPGPTAVR